MKISILTLFPQMFSGPFDHSIIKIAKEKKIVEINFVDIRNFGIGKHRIVDDRPYGGGRGMVLRVDVAEKAIKSVAPRKSKKQKIILIDARGKKFDQKKAQELTNYDHLVLFCGHYEGFDERILNFVDESISIGDFILTGGEIPAMAITDAVVRLIPGVIKEESAKFESFSLKTPSLIPVLEHPQYTQPRVYKKLKVPEILLSGNHEKIVKWREEKSIEYTMKNRPDLLKIV